MDINKYPAFNTQRFEQHLSPFGKKVLQTLVKQWNEKARTQNNNDYQHRYRREQSYPNYSRKRALANNTNAELPRVLTFMEEKPFNFNITQSVSQEVPKSVEMILTLKTDEASDNNRDAINHPSIITNKILANSSFNKDSHVTNPNKMEAVYRNTNKSPAMDINWNDMFDAELFSDKIVHEINKNDRNVVEGDQLYLECNTYTSNQDEHFSNYVQIVNNNKINEKGVKRKNNIKHNNNIKIKKVLEEDTLSKKSPANHHETTPMFDIPKANFRKQKYTKTVKNWLDNIALDENIHFNKTLADTENQSNKFKQDTNDDTTVNNVSNMLNIVIESSKNPKKKIVQSCLANKDGVMKFCKPKNDKNNDEIRNDINNKTNETNNLLLNDIPEMKPMKEIMAENKVSKGQKSEKKAKKVKETENSVIKANKARNKVTKEDNSLNKEAGTKLETKINKDKKVKKFIAPIKSQIPVNDVLYDIVTIEENNVYSSIAQIQDIADEEIAVVLMYSNGFNQLNKHYTDDTCIPVGFIISYDDRSYYFKDCNKNISGPLKRMFESNKIVCYDGRSILIFLASHLEIDISSVNMYDTKIGSSLLDPDHLPENFTDVQKILCYTPPYTVATDCTLQKAAWYTTLLKECWTKLNGLLIQNSLCKVFVDIEMRLLPIIANMERRGVPIDVVKLKSMEEVLLARLKQVEQECYKAAGKVFQINSTVQVRAILYDELQLDEKSNIKINETLCKGAKSTAETMLRNLSSVHPLPRLILEYRHLHKAHTTFLAGIAQHVKDGVVKPTWEQTAASTGRIASNNPNLQAIPKAPFNLVMFPDTNENVCAPLNFRSVYVSHAGYSLLAADFKHIECRVFAHASADTALMNALASDDLFKVLAAKWLKKPESDILPAERERTKRLVYASLYGAGTRKLMEILDVSYEQALQVATNFNRTFPSLKSFGRAVVQRCADGGRQLSTQGGRVRQFARIASADHAARAHAERQAVNFVVQGSAADICKIAMILTDEQLREACPALDAQLLLQIHDELVWHVRDGHVDRAAMIIKRVMEGCGRHCGMAVSLPVAVSVGRSWGDLQPYSLPQL